MIAPKRREQIEKIVRGLHTEIVQGARLRYPSGMPPLPTLFSPDAAIETNGYSFEVRESMPSAYIAHDSQTAGMIDNVRKIVIVKAGLAHEAYRFTTAHELGHLVLHQEQLGGKLHRDRPVSGANMGPRSTLEQEADYFAALFLAPSKTVEYYFKQRFGNIPLALSDLTAYHVAGHKGAQDLMASKPDSLAFPMAVARAEKFGPKRFDSLAHFFGMSPTAMAIRLKELNLVVY